MALSECLLSPALSAVKTCFGVAPQRPLAKGIRSPPGDMDVTVASRLLCDVLRRFVRDFWSRRGTYAVSFCDWRMHNV
jgi:hypothetical protein